MIVGKDRKGKHLKKNQRKAAKLAVKKSLTIRLSNSLDLS